MFKRSLLGFLGYASIAVFLVGVALPSAYAVLFAFSDAKLFDNSFRLVGFSTFLRLFSDRDFLAALIKTSIFAFVSATLVTTMGCILALSVGEREALRKIVATAVFVPWLMSEAGIASIWRWLFDPVGGLLSLGGFLATKFGAFFVIVLVEFWREFAFGFLLIVAGLEAIPVELVEACRIDGLNEKSILLKLKLPLLSRIIGLVFILSFARAAGEFGTIYLITSGGPAQSTEFLSIYMFKRLLYYHDLSGASAVGVLMMLTFIVLGLSISLLGLRRRWEKSGYLWR